MCLSSHIPRFLELGIVGLASELVMGSNWKESQPLALFENAVFFFFFSGYVLIGMLVVGTSLLCVSIIRSLGESQGWGECQTLKDNFPLK